ncbi:MAG: class I SAM-dependent methyltransferase [Myxococcota bacterium]
MGRDLRDAVDRGWKTGAALDAALAAGEIDEDVWYARQQDAIVPHYLAATSPRAQSGHSGDAERWRRARGFVIEAVDRDGTFLDIGCANGHLMESVVIWGAEKGVVVEPYGVDLSPELVALAQRRLPHWANRIWTGNGLTVQAPRRMTFVHVMALSIVPVTRRGELLDHLLGAVCAPGGRLIIGPFNEIAEHHTAMDEVEALGGVLGGQIERPHRTPGIVRRMLWIDA